MQACVHPHQALQPHQVIGRLHDVLAVVQGQLILARREFGDQRLRLDPRRLGAGVDVIEQGQHAVQLVDRIHVGLGIPAPVQHIARRDHLAVRIALIFQKEELQLEGAGREQPLARQRIDLPLQGVARVRGHLAAVEIVERQEHLAPRRGGAGQRHQRAGDGPGAAVAVALVPDQAGFMHILAADVEAQDRDRHVPARLVDRQKLMAADDLAAPDAVGIVQDDVERLDLGMRGEEGFGFGDGRAGGAVIFGHGVLRRKVRSGRCRRRRSDGPLGLSWSWG